MNGGAMRHQWSISLFVSKKERNGEERKSLNASNISYWADCSVKAPSVAQVGLKSEREHSINT